MTECDRKLSPIPGRLFMAGSSSSGDKYDAVYDRIRRVVDERLFSLVFQPVVSAREGWVKGYEFFTRFNGVPQVTPDKIFGEAEKVGLRETLELTVIGHALAYLPDIPEGIYLSINISPDTLLSGELRSLLPERSLNRLVLEISQHAEISDYGALVAALEPMRRWGLRLAVDNAGVCYRNFRHIRILRPDILKLDRSITRDVDTDRPAKSLAATLIRDARALGMSVVAEGIETRGQLATVRQLTVDQVQGYLTGRPVAFEQLPD